MFFASCPLDIGRFVHGSMNEGGDDLLSAVRDEEGGVAIVVNETLGRCCRDCKGR